MVTNGFVGLDVCGCVDVCILTWVLRLYVLHANIIF